MDGTAYEIVGIVNGYANAPLHRARPAFFLPLDEQQSTVKRVQFLVRATGRPDAMTEPIRRQVRDLRQGNVISMVTTIDRIIQISGQEVLVTTFPLAPLIGTGLLLTAAGIYGVLAFAVTRRSSELALRIAVGARRGHLLSLMLMQSLRVVLVGLACGVGLTFALTRVAQGAGGIFDSPGWQAFAIPILIVLAVGALATWIPSRRALRIDAARLLRTT